MLPCLFRSCVLWLRSVLYKVLCCPVCKGGGLHAHFILLMKWDLVQDTSLSPFLFLNIVLCGQGAHISGPALVALCTMAFHSIFMHALFSMEVKHKICDHLVGSQKQVTRPPG